MGGEGSRKDSERGGARGPGGRASSEGHPTWLRRGWGDGEGGGGSDHDIYPGIRKKRRMLWGMYMFGGGVCGKAPRLPFPGSTNILNSYDRYLDQTASSSFKETLYG